MTERFRNDHEGSHRIAYLATPVDFGGAERVSLTLLRNFQLDKTTIHPILLVRPWETDNLFLNELKKSEIPFRLVPTRIRPREQGRDYFRLLRAVTTIYKEIKTGKFDLIHSNGYFADILATIISKLIGIPIISTCHGFIFNTKRLSVYNRLDIYALRQMSAIIAVSSELQDHLTKRGVPANKIHVIRNAIQPLHDSEGKQKRREFFRHQYTIKNEEFLIGYIGRLSDEKGLRYLFEAAKKLVQSNVPLRLLIIGDGPQRQELENLAEKSCLADNVIFTGFLENPTQILPALDIFALPSLTEGTSMSLLEAMSCGLAVVATGVGGTSKVISTGRNGLLVSPADSEAIYRVLTKLIEDTALKQKLGTEAKKTIETHFNLADWLLQIELLYTSVIEQSQLSSG